MAKLRITATVEVELPTGADLLEQYEADTYLKAAANQLEWIENGETDIHDLLGTDKLNVTVDLVI